MTIVNDICNLLVLTAVLASLVFMVWDSNHK